MTVFSLLLALLSVDLRNRQRIANPFLVEFKLNEGQWNGLMLALRRKKECAILRATRIGLLAIIERPHLTGKVLR